MSRIVLTGAPGALYRPTPADLPADKDLSHSYFRYVDASGFDLSLYDLTDVDILDSDCRNVILPAKIDYLMSRRTLWTGAKIPATVSSYNHDLVVEALKQRYVLATAANKPRLQRVYQWVAADYTHSWQDSIWQLINVGGYSVTQIRNAFNAAFAPYPGLLSRLKSHLDRSMWQQASPSLVQNLTAIGHTPDDGSPTVDVTGVLSGLDRWANARALEVAFGGFWYVAMLDPHPVVFWAGRVNDPDWWQSAWGLR